ncbi:MAG: DUF6892 domain-containing protein [Polyangiales bacterium]
MPMPITDAHLRLAIVDRLIVEGVLPRFDRKKFILEKKLPRGEGERARGEAAPEDGDDPDYRKVREIQKELLSWLKPKHLPKVTTISWGGGARVQHWIWTFWDGEGGEFDVEDLTGIAACTSLRALSGHCFRTGDLEPLSGMETLESLHLGTGGKTGVTDVRPLATLRRLKKLDLSDHGKLNDLSPLAGHPALEELHLSCTAVTDLAFALELPKLKRLRASTWGAGAQLAEKNAAVLSALKKRKVDLKVT